MKRKRNWQLRDMLQKLVTQWYARSRTTSFSVRVFFHRHWRLKWRQGREETIFLLFSTTSVHSKAFRYLFATLHVRWPRILICTACNYQTTTWWHLSGYWVTIWLIVDGMLISVYLTIFFYMFYYSNSINESRGF